MCSPSWFLMHNILSLCTWWFKKYLWHLIKGPVKHLLKVILADSTSSTALLTCHRKYRRFVRHNFPFQILLLVSSGGLERICLCSYLHWNADFREALDIFIQLEVKAIQSWGRAFQDPLARHSLRTSNLVTLVFTILPFFLFFKHESLVLTAVSWQTSVSIQWSYLATSWQHGYDFSVKYPKQRVRHWNFQRLCWSWQCFTVVRFLSCEKPTFFFPKLVPLVSVIAATFLTQTSNMRL